MTGEGEREIGDILPAIGCEQRANQGNFLCHAREVVSLDVDGNTLLLCRSFERRRARPLTVCDLNPVLHVINDGMTGEREDPY